MTALLLAALGNLWNHFASGQTSAPRMSIGIRLALGATRTRIPGIILRQGLEIAGAAAGLVGALIVSHLMAGLLYGVL